MAASAIETMSDSWVKPAARWTLTHGIPRTAMRVAARRGDLNGRLIMASAALQTDDGAEIHAICDEIRASGTLHRSRFSYATAHLETVREVLTSNDVRTGFEPPSEQMLTKLSRWANTPAALGPLAPPSLLVTEPPDHTRYRKLVTRVFTVRAVQRLQERTEEIAAKLLDQLDPSAPVDLIEAYCTQLPLTLICEILGVPEHDRDKVLEFGTSAAPSLDMGLSWSSFRGVEDALRRFEVWLDEHLARLRDNPGDDLMSQLVLAEDDGVGLTPEELKSTAGLVLAAGFETTVNLLGNGIRLLHDHPSQLATLRERPELWANASDEVLRYDPPVLLTGRMVARDTTIGGRPVSAGSMIATVLTGANRDPEVFTDPHTFDVARDNAREHVSFSAGRHYCLGAALARMEGEVGLRAIFERYPDLRLLPGARRRSTRILRGFEKLPTRLT